MRLSDRYFFQELLGPFAAATGIVLMLLVSSGLYSELEPMVRNHWPIALVIQDLLLTLPSSMVLALPVSTAIAASMTINRMARDNEITVLRSFGLTLKRAFVPLVLFGLLTSILNLWIANRVVPWAAKEQARVKDRAGNFNSDNARPIELGLTIPIENKVVTFNTAQKVSDKRYRLDQIVIVERPPAGTNDFTRIMTAETADYENGKWSLQNVVYHNYGKDGMAEADLHQQAATLNMRIDFSALYQMQSGQQFDRLSYEDLTQRAEDSARYGNISEARTLEVERWFKLSLPMMGVVLVICGAPLSLRFARTGAFTGVLLAIIIIFVGWNTLLLMKYVAFGGLLPPIVAAWFTNVLFLIIGFVLIWTQE